MTVTQMLVESKYAGGLEKVVKQVRGTYNEYPVDLISRIVGEKKEDCEAVIEAIKQHPDWDDEKIAQTVNWTI